MYATVSHGSALMPVLQLAMVLFKASDWSNNRVNERMCCSAVALTSAPTDHSAFFSIVFVVKQEAGAHATLKAHTGPDRRPNLINCN